MKRLTAEVLSRRKQWERLYSPEYIRRFFTLYDGELEALLEDVVKCRKRNTQPMDTQ
jgi:hypothetical protein